jgi:excisionase family DNA binding protein
MNDAMISFIADRVIPSDAWSTATRPSSWAEAILHAKPAELEQVSALRDQIAAMLQSTNKTYLVGANGERTELPSSAVEALKLVVDALARGQSVTLVPQDKDLTSQEAADTLRVSRPHLIKLLDRGESPFHRVGTHRRVRLEDVLAYRERRDAERAAALTELTRLSEELPGGYR